jgi:hypothetical protein
LKKLALPAACAASLVADAVTRAGSHAIEHVTLIDGLGHAPLRDMTVEVDGCTYRKPQLSIVCESVDNHGDGRSPQVDLVRRGWAVPVARSLAKPKFSPFGISSMC